MHTDVRMERVVTTEVGVSRLGRARCARVVKKTLAYTILPFHFVIINTFTLYILDACFPSQTSSSEDSSLTNTTAAQLKLSLQI